MGLLTALEHFYSNSEEPSEIVEYTLVSWGEIFPPFPGDREHSTAARFILRDFPFRLFSITRPYSSQPQKLNLTFRVPVELEQVPDIFPGFFPEDVAKEFAAFLSLVTRRRVFPIKQTRLGNLPVEKEISLHESSHFQYRQGSKEIDPESFYTRLKKLSMLDNDVARSFMLAARLYHSAVEMMYTEPEFSYLFLVMSLETISSVVNKNYRVPKEKSEAFLDSTFTGWRDLVDAESGITKEKVVEILLRNQHFTFRKMLKFVEDNLPDDFWKETTDDAKADYVLTVIEAGPDGYGLERFERSDTSIMEWERFDQDELKQTLRAIYDARSQLVHGGVPLPSSILFSYPKIPGREALKMFAMLFKKERRTLPTLLTFERLVSYSLASFLDSQ